MLNTAWYFWLKLYANAKNIEKTYNTHLKPVRIDLQQLTFEHYAQLHMQA